MAMLMTTGVAAPVGTALIQTGGAVLVDVAATAAGGGVAVATGTAAAAGVGAGATAAVTATTAAATGTAAAASIGGGIALAATGIGILGLVGIAVGEEINEGYHDAYNDQNIELGTLSGMINIESDYII